VGKKRPVLCLLLSGLHLFLGLGAVFGGLALIIDPTGDGIGMPLSMLEHSPFSNFFVPGIILFLVLGVIPLVISYSLLKKPQWSFTGPLNLFKEKHWSWSYSLYIGFALIIWISVQVFIIQAASSIHVIYWVLGLIIQIMSLLPSVQKHYLIGENR
jgi:hypothetical protein